MDAAFALAKVVVTPIFKEVMQVLGDVRDCEENTKLVEDVCERMECHQCYIKCYIKRYIKRFFEDNQTTMMTECHQCYNNVQKALEKAEQLVNNSREPQQRARYCNNWLLSKPNLSREIRNCNAEFNHLIDVLNEHLVIFKLVQKAVLLKHVQSRENTSGDEELRSEFAACTIHHNGGEILSVEAKQLCCDLMLQYNLRARKEIIM